MLSARWIPWSLVMLGCAPNDLEVLDGGAAFDSGARTDRAVIDAPRTDGPRADAAIAMDAAPATDATASDATAPDAAATDGPRADGGPADARAACTVTPSAEPFRSPVLRLHWRATAGAFRGVDQVCSTPAVADIVREAPDEERVPEVAFMTFDCAASYANAVLRVISGRAPYTLRWSQNGADRPNAEGTPSTLKWDGHPAIADLDGVPGNGLEVVAVTQSNGLIAFRSNGNVYWRTQEARGSVTGANPSVNIADLDADGVPEVIAGASVFNGRTGAVRWVGAAARGVNGQGPLSVVADLDGDGYLEVIAGRTVYENNGRVRFGSPTADGFAAVADILDAAGRSGRDGTPEILAVANGVLYALDPSRGAVRWQVTIPGMTTLGGAPTVGDFDGDGQMEVGIAGAGAYSVLDPGCTGPTNGCAAANVRWSTVTEDTSSQVTSSTVFDFNGDGASEVVYNDEERFQVLDGRTGRVVFQDYNPSQTRTEQAIVADADGDGRADIIFGANQCAAFAGNTIPMGMTAAQRVPGLEIWSSGDGSWVGARATWNEHGYHIDNIGDLGEIPRPEPPSWRTHNTFRLNSARDRTLAAPDLTGAGDGFTCRGGAVELCVNVTNRGDARVGPLSVGFYDRAPATGVRPLVTASTGRNLDPTQTARVCATLMTTTPPARVFFRVDDAAAARECDEENNVGTLAVDCGPM
jgi:hypothetical protein